MMKLLPGGWRRRWRSRCRAPSWFEAHLALSAMRSARPGSVITRAFPWGQSTQRLMLMRLSAARCRIERAFPPIRWDWSIDQSEDIGGARASGVRQHARRRGALIGANYGLDDAAYSLPSWQEAITYHAV